MSVVLSIVLGVISGVGASAVWVVALRMVKPKIDISHEVSEDPESPEELPAYRIKLVNRSRRAAMDLRFQLDLIRPVRTRGGIIFRREPIKLDNIPPILIKAYQKSDKEAHNAYRIRFDSSVGTKMRDDKGVYLRLQVFARHEVSGIGRVFEQIYYDPDSDIIIGRFEKGQTMKIVPARRS